MMGKQPLHNSKRSIVNSAFPSLNRQIGITVSPPWVHSGLREVVVDIETESPILNTETRGQIYLSTEWTEKTIENYTSLISNLDDLIDELTEHRDRLEDERFEMIKNKVAREDLEDLDNMSSL